MGTLQEGLFSFLSVSILGYNDHRGTISPEANHGHGKAKRGKARLDSVRAREALDMDTNVFTIDGFVDILFACGLAVDVAEDFIASLHAARARRRCACRRLILAVGWTRSGGGGGGGGSNKASGAEEEARGGGAQNGEQRGVDEVRVAGARRGKSVGEGEGRGGERRQRDERRLQRGGEVGEGGAGGGGGGELEERGEGEARDGIGDTLGKF